MELIFYTFKKRLIFHFLVTFYRNKISVRIENLKIPSYLAILMIKRTYQVSNTWENVS